MPDDTKPASGAPAEQQAGQVVTPQSAPTALPEQPTAVAQPAPIVEQQPIQNTPEPAIPEEESSGFSSGFTKSDKPINDDVIAWSASEYIAHDKSVGWYLNLTIVTVVITALVLLLTRDKISASVVIVGGLAFGFYATRKPNQQQYHLDNKGLSIGQKYFPFPSFKSFSLAQEGAFSSIVFMPHKRFAPLTIVYYSPEDEDRITNILSEHLPFEEHEPALIDNLMHRIRF